MVFSGEEPMSLESMFEAFGLVGAIAAGAYYLAGARKVFKQGTQIAFAVVLLVSVSKYFINALEWSNLLTDVNLDYAEDYLDDIWPFAWFLFFFASLMDVSAQRIRESETRYRLIFNSSRDAILLLKKSGHIIDFNHATITITGHDATSLGKITLQDLYPTHELPLKKNSSNAKAIEAELIKKDGRKVETEYNSRWIEMEGQEIVHFEIRDITNRKQTERSLADTQKIRERWKKMESLGLLAGGVAHDLNNILSAIISYPELILLDLPKESNLRKPLEIIKEAGQKSADIVQDLLTLAKGVAITTEPLNLNDCIRDYLYSSIYEQLRMVNPLVTIITELKDDLFNIEGSQVHIRKVLMNLMSNAAEAIEHDGKVCLSTTNRCLDRNSQGYQVIPAGEYAVLSVSDDGSGISPEHLERVFEPFYSKKIMGRQGTGLGLSVVWNVIQEHGGYVDLKSDDKGTTFDLYFPISRNIVSKQKCPLSMDDLMGKGETILVVDDLKSQQEIVCQMLQKLGYSGISVDSGEQAIEYLKKEPVDLVILDMIMDPGINGRETYEGIIALRPTQKAIVTSGYAETDDVKKVLQLGAGQFLKKPLSISILGHAIKHELHK